ncbi:hypothetical protein SYNTR_1979 [Candidatus Syntrophocurvum alkaliphilum]|uniref:Uncharacterized protein n=1 Tax=Candidatus Syntrophocurvum alkaliphilum TaxID=2293317 RepID=A0A6I6DHL1_9FIRM|nr:YhcN/YlaJ family sporulation lipoprotein [Candidatus Syntrophocurvum alkaliphilum]QGU00573.1 hypothetical protein SYNTR_1979 [Candidatus Syntrophocurvum alkaliphilum]
MKRKIALFLCISFITSIFMMGCGTAAQRPVPPEQEQDQTTDLSTSERRVMASSISNIAEQVEGVERAAVVVTTEADTMNLDQQPNGVSPSPDVIDTPPPEGADVRDNATGVRDDATGVRDDVTTPRDTNVGQDGRTVPMQDGQAPMRDVSPTPRDIGAPGPTEDRVTVMVGLDMNDEAADDANRRQEIQQEVVTSIEESDPRIEEVLVTTDPNLVRQINDIAAGIIDGRPIQEFQEDIIQLNNEIQPERRSF